MVNSAHGGFDGGAVAESGITEKELNLQISLKLASALKQHGCEVIMTRESDSALCKGASSGKTGKNEDLKKRVQIANNNPDALFVSIHQNKFEDSAINGLQVFYKNGNLPAEQLAKYIQGEVCEKLQIGNKRVAKSDTRGVYILENCNSAAVIVECGFISNRSELEKLQNDDYQAQLAFCITNGILKYIVSKEV